MNARTAQRVVLDAIDEKATAMGLRGVGVAFVVEPTDDSNQIEPGFVIVGQFHRGPKLSNEVEDNGANYMCVAWSKMAQMLRVGDDSGHDPVKGEFPYKGGILREVAGRKVLVAFSGGTEQQDLEVSETAIASLAGYMRFRRWGEEEQMQMSGLLIVYSMLG